MFCFCFFQTSILLSALGCRVCWLVCWTHCSAGFVVSQIPSLSQTFAVHPDSREQGLLSRWGTWVLALPMRTVSSYFYKHCTASWEHWLRWGSLTEQAGGNQHALWFWPRQRGLKTNPLLLCGWLTGSTWALGLAMPPERGGEKGALGHRGFWEGLPALSWANSVAGEHRV